jgi:hypothetical protein
MVKKYVVLYLVLRCREGMCGRASSEIPGTAFHTPGFGHVGPNAGTDQVHCSLQGRGCKPNPAAIYQILLAGRSGGEVMDVQGTHSYSQRGRERERASEKERKKESEREREVERER